MEVITLTVIAITLPLFVKSNLRSHIGGATQKTQPHAIHGMIIIMVYGIKIIAYYCI
jgi:hypothetical protein